MPNTKRMDGTLNQADQPYFHKRPSRLLAVWSLLLVGAISFMVFRLLSVELLDLDLLAHLL
jgi:hypothetical protein